MSELILPQVNLPRAPSISHLAEDITDHSSLSEHSSSSKEEEHQASPPFLRRSTRQRHPPNWHKDYVK